MYRGLVSLGDAAGGDVCSRRRLGVQHMPDKVLNLLIRRLEAITSISEDEKKAILNLPVKLTDLRADADIFREGDRPSQCCLLVEGFLTRYKDLSNGKRQIMAFYVPGDIPDLLSLHIDVMDHSLATIAPSKAAFIPHDALRRLIDQHSRIANAFWRDTLIDAALFREWIVNVGSRDAYTRIGHLICEVFMKLKAVGLTDGNSFDFPITQGEIGDATGLSTVHVNRSIMALRADGLIILEKGRCTIPDLKRLKKAAMFDPTYLHLTRERRSGNGPLGGDETKVAP
jgi:CRP-like cAMP-binding protein